MRYSPDRYDKLIPNAWWLYRDDLISKDVLLEFFDNMKKAETERQSQILKFEEDIANKKKGEMNDELSKA